MRPHLLLLLFLLPHPPLPAAEPDFPLTEDTTPKLSQTVATVGVQALA